MSSSINPSYEMPFCCQGYWPLLWPKRWHKISSQSKLSAQVRDWRQPWLGDLVLITGLLSGQWYPILGRGLQRRISAHLKLNVGTKDFTTDGPRFWDRKNDDQPVKVRFVVAPWNHPGSFLSFGKGFSIKIWETSELRDRISHRKDAETWNHFCGLKILFE